MFPNKMNLCKPWELAPHHAYVRLGSGGTENHGLAQVTAGQWQALERIPDLTLGHVL